MTDIVEKLRQGDHHDFDRQASLNEDRYVCMCEHIANEAADEIERLRKIEAAAKVLISDVPNHSAEFDALKQLEELCK